MMAGPVAGAAHADVGARHHCPRRHTDGSDAVGAVRLVRAVRGAHRRAGAAREAHEDRQAHADERRGGAPHEVILHQFCHRLHVFQCHLEAQCARLVEGRRAQPVDERPQRRDFEKDEGKYGQD